MKNGGKENGFSFKSIVTFPPVQMSIFKENSPLKDESIFEMSPIFDLMLQNANNQNLFYFQVQT